MKNKLRQRQKIKKLLKLNMIYFRVTAGAKQSCVAKALHISQPQYYKYEYTESEIPLDILYRFSLLFGISVSQLFCDEIYKRISANELRAISKDRSCLAVARTLSRVKDPQARKKLVELITDNHAKKL